MKLRENRSITPAKTLRRPLLPDSRLFPVIIISHGLGSDRNSFRYLAQQLASYGFAVTVPEHPNSNAEQLRSLLNGGASAVTPPREFINRPLDVSYLLNVLAQLDRGDSSFALYMVERPE